MRNLIVRALEWALSLLTPPSGTRRATAPATVAPAPPSVDPWSQPWTTPSKEEAAAIFAAERTLTLTLQAQRRRAAEPATVGRDVPYTYPGAPFPAPAFDYAEGIR